MDEYIKRKELAEMIENNVNLPYGEGYTGKDHELVEWCKGECIRMAHCLPFVCDVVPKSEVESFNKSKGGFCPLCGSYTITQGMMEKLRMAHKEQGQHGDPVGEKGVNALKAIKSEVAREIFEEIEKHILENCCVTDDDVDGIWKHIAELKKKYT